MLSKIGTMLLVFALVRVASAQPLPEDFPEGEVIENKMCYDIEGFKIIAKYAIDSKSCAESKKVLEKTIDTQKEAITSLEKAIDLHEESISVLKQENTRLFDLWKEENKKRHEAENVPKWGSAEAWIAAGVATLVAGGAVTYAIIK